MEYGRLEWRVPDALTGEPMTADNSEGSKKAGPWDRAGAILLAALIGVWLVAYIVVAARAWLGIR